MIFHCVRVYTRAYAFNFVLEKDPKQINRIAGDTHTGRERVRKKESERRKVKKKKNYFKVIFGFILGTRDPQLWTDLGANAGAVERRKNT